MGNLARLLDPGSIVVVGGERAALAIEQCRSLGFAGDLWAVNPERPELAGVTTVASVSAVPGIPDAAFVAVDRHRSVEVVASLAELGVGGAVCYASGFAESGAEGETLQARLVDAAADMALMGPNCHGFVNALSGAALWPDVQGCTPVDRGIAIITQSGNLAINITMQQRGIALSHVITLGNQAGVRIEDCLSFLVDDRRVTAIGLHIEALLDPTAFGLAAMRAYELGKPIVVLKTGLTEEGASIARTHTASLAGSGAGYQALFERYAVAQVDTLPELLSALSVLGTYGWLGANRLVSLSCSGGEAGLIADRAAGRQVVFPRFTPESAEAISATLSHRVPITNPLDYHTFIWGDLATMTACFTAALGSGVDAGLLVIDFPFPGTDDTWWWPTLEAFVAAHRATGVPAVVTSTLPENLPLRVAAWLAQRSLPAVPGIDDALAALDAASLVRVRPTPHHPSPKAPVSVRSLGEHQTKERLASAGVAVPLGRVVPRSGLATTAAAIGYPVVLKATGIEHKSDAGGVVVGIETAADLERLATSMAVLGSEFLVESFISGAVAELIVGVRRHHPIGWTVTIGAGGVLAELIEDSVTLLAPVEPAEIERAIRSLRVSKLITGHRNQPGGNIDATVEAVSRIAAMVSADESIVELEVNPLLVFATGAMAVDALALIEEN